MEILKTSISTVNRVDSLEQVFAALVLGRPSSNCKHLGICKVERIYSNDFYSNILSGLCNESSKMYALATLQKGVYFELAFQRAFMDRTNFDLHFKEGVFIMEEDFIFEEGFMSTPFCVKAGHYKIRFTDRLVVVRFGLK